MANQNKLTEMLKARNPLQREVVTPVKMYTSTQVDKPTSVQTDKTTKPLVHNPTSIQVGKRTKPQVGKYTTHLPLELIKAIKRTALEAGKKDYEVVKEAVETYLKGKGTPIT